MACTSTTNAKLGGEVRAGYENSRCDTPSPLGTALDLTAYSDARLCAEITPQITSNTEDINEVGCGDSSGLGTVCPKPDKEYRFGLTSRLKFGGGFQRILAQFMGASTAPVEVTATQGDYRHQLSFASTANLHFGTFAYLTTRTDIIEAINTYTESVGVSWAEGDNYPRWSAGLIANDLQTVSASAVNSYADINTLTMADPELVGFKCSNALRIKNINDDGSDGALSGGDLVKISGFDLSFERQHGVVKEWAGSSTCPAPSASGIPTGTLTLNFRDLQNHNFINAWKNDTGIYQATLEMTGPQIGTGAARTLKIYLPKLCLTEFPNCAITNTQRNGFSLTFQIKASVNAITGQPNLSPTFEFINKRASRYLVV